MLLLFDTPSSQGLPREKKWVQACNACGARYIYYVIENTFEKAHGAKVPSVPTVWEAETSGLRTGYRGNTLGLHSFSHTELNNECNKRRLEALSRR